MKTFLFALALCMLLIRCADTSEHPCATMATVVDLTGLDGCGFVFELEDGTRLEPIRLMYCGTPPLPKEQIEDPLYDFEFVNGKKVLISFTFEHTVTACMAGAKVKITCLSEILESAVE